MFRVIVKLKNSNDTNARAHQIWTCKRVKLVKSDYIFWVHILWANQGPCICLTPFKCKIFKLVMCLYLI